MSRAEYAARVLSVHHSSYDIHVLMSVGLEMDSLNHLLGAFAGASGFLLRGETPSHFNQSVRRCTKFVKPHSDCTVDEPFVRFDDVRHMLR